MIEDSKKKTSFFWPTPKPFKPQRSKMTTANKEISPTTLSSSKNNGVSQGTTVSPSLRRSTTAPTVLAPINIPSNDLDPDDSYDSYDSYDYSDEDYESQSYFDVENIPDNSSQNDAISIDTSSFIYADDDDDYHNYDDDSGNDYGSDLSDGNQDLATSATKRSRSSH